MGKRCQNANAIDLCDELQSAESVVVVFVLLNVQFSPYCAIILPKNDLRPISSLHVNINVV